MDSLHIVFNAKLAQFCIDHTKSVSSTTPVRFNQLIREYTAKKRPVKPIKACWTNCYQSFAVQTSVNNDILVDYRYVIIFGLIEEKYYFVIKGNKNMLYIGCKYGGGDGEYELSLCKHHLILNLIIFFI